MCSATVRGFVRRPPLWFFRLSQSDRNCFLVELGLVYVVIRILKSLEYIMVQKHLYALVKPWDVAGYESSTSWIGLAPSLTTGHLGAAPLALSSLKCLTPWTHTPLFSSLRDSALRRGGESRCAYGNWQLALGCGGIAAAVHRGYCLSSF